MTTEQPIDEQHHPLSGQSKAEAYLNDLDDCLIVYLDDPRVRLDHIEEAAQLLLASNTDPVDEFGSAISYAQTLAGPIDSSITPYWIRGIAMTAGLMLLLQGVDGLIDLLVLIGDPDMQGFQTTHIGSSIFIAGFISFFWVYPFSPLFLRFMAKGTGPEKLWRSAIPVLAVIFLIVLNEAFLGDDLLTFTLPASSIYFPITGACLALGAGLIYLSQIPHRFLGVLQNNMRSGSVLRYNPFAFRKIRFRTPWSPALPAHQIQNPPNVPPSQ